MEYGLHQFVRSATRHENILDIVISNNPRIISTIDVLCPISTSDHNVISFRRNIPLTLSRNIMHPLNLFCFGAETQVDSMDTSVERYNLGVNILEIALSSGTLTRNPSEISDIFNFYFSSVFTIENNENPITSCETQPEVNEVRFTPDVIRMTLLGLNSSLSTGPGGIPNIVLKKSMDLLWLYRLPIYLTFPLKIKSCPVTGKWH